MTGERVSDEELRSHLAAAEWNERYDQTHPDFGQDGNRGGTQSDRYALDLRDARARIATLEAHAAEGEHASLARGLIRQAAALMSDDADERAKALAEMQPVRWEWKREDAYFWFVGSRHQQDLVNYNGYETRPLFSTFVPAKPAPAQDVIFDRLHLEAMTREWFAGPNPTVDGYLAVLQLRLARAEPVPAHDDVSEDVVLAALAAQKNAIKTYEGTKPQSEEEAKERLFAIERAAIEAAFAFAARASKGARS